MPRFPVSPYWSSNPNIPIYLDQIDDRREPHEQKVSEHTHPRHVPEYTCPTCETSSRDTPIHCISVSPAAPPSYSSITPKAPPYRQHLAVPTLTVETPRDWTRPRPPSRTLQIDPEGRPHVRFRRNAFSPISPTTTEFDEIDWSRKSHIGLGIPDAPFRPDTSPITPGTAEKRGEEDSTNVESASNLAQRIEQKLWNYTASRSVIKRWLIEIISWCLSAACMAGIGIMLIVYKNKTIPRWPLGLTLNAYISVLAKVASAALLLPVSEALGQLKWSWFQGDSSKKMWDFELFDSASRGPWGSFLLLVRTKGKSLAALGACVTLMALMLDPFFQQVVEYPEVWRVQQGKGALPRAFGYEPFAKGQEYQGGEQYMDTDMNLQGTLARYFYDNGTIPMPFGRGFRAEVPLACPNSNCTWPEYETLGVHSECVDIKDRLEFKCLRKELDWVQVPIKDPQLIEAISFPNGTACGWWTKADDPLLMVGYNVDKNTEHAGEVLLSRVEPLYNLFSKIFMPGYENKLNSSRNPLAHIILVSNENLDDVYQNKTPIAKECMISWCAKTIQSSYSEGGYVEKVTQVVLNDTVTSSPWITSMTRIGDSRRYNYEYFYDENTTITTANNTYIIDNSTFVLTAAVFDDVFPSAFTLINSTDQKDAMLRYKQYNEINPYIRNVTYNPFMMQNISTHLENMASAFTNLMRSASLDTEMVPGDAFDQENIVQVRWWWLSLPLSLLICTGIFLLATVIRSSKEQDHVGVWKTSAIATLLYGLPDDMSKKMTSEKAHGTPRAKAKEVKVKWIPKRGWRFSGLSVSPTSLKNGLSPTSPRPNSTIPTKARQSPPVETTQWI
ncbi:hypothetical protein N0V90_004946 [Kalmusia sp. IMI 367209]|nr:hypothetical protein N0V90_004946 [Kalmusia sp. IMI 367209]